MIRKLLVILLSVLGLTRTAPATYDLRQDGDLNVKVDLENFVILVAKPVSPLDVFGSMSQLLADSRRAAAVTGAPESELKSVMEPRDTSKSEEVAGEPRKSSVSEEKPAEKSSRSLEDVVTSLRNLRDGKAKPAAGKYKFVESVEEPQNFKLVGDAVENCGPGRSRDHQGICQGERLIQEGTTGSSAEGHEGQEEDVTGSVTPMLEKEKKELVEDVSSAPWVLDLSSGGGDNRIKGRTLLKPRRKAATSPEPAGRQGGGGGKSSFSIFEESPNNNKMEASINMRVFKAFLVMLSILATYARASPLLNYSPNDDFEPNYNQTSSYDSKKEPELTHYDQRQNGTENYRVKVDGLVFILAPADSLLLAGAALEPNFTSLFTENNKPKPKPEKEFNKSKDTKDVLKSVQHENAHVPHRPVLRISNLIAPFLNRITSMTKTDKINLHKSADVSR